MTIFVLTYEYYDKSGFYVCGTTTSGAIANTWRAAGDGQHRVYRTETDSIMNATTGYKEWK